VPHDRPKQLWVRELHPQARQWLSAPTLPPELQAYEKAAPSRCEHNSEQLACLRERFAAVREFRRVKASAIGSLRCWR